MASDHTTLLKDFIGLFNARDYTPEGMAKIYAPEVRFQDPLHVIEGRDALLAYFQRMEKNVRHVHFDAQAPIIDGDRASIAWVMNLQLRKGITHPINVDGISVLKLGERVEEHRDYFDLGQLMYEHVPALGWVIRKIKGSLSPT